MDDNDPISQFFPGEVDVNLYAVLNIFSDSGLETIKRAYRRLALNYHPDKHANSTEEVKADASVKFQQIGFAYAVLGDEKRRARYDKTGKTDEGFELAAGEDGWEAYFEDLFQRLTRGKLDAMKKAYQGTEEELADLKRAYLETKGSIAEIMTHIPHSTHEDEPRFVMTLSSLIAKKELEATRLWKKNLKDEKAMLARRKEGEKEAKEAEELAKELGVWDEFYGSGKVSKRKKRKGKAAETAAGEGEEDHSALQALILKKRKKNLDDLVDDLAAKYAPKSKRKGKKRAREEDVEEMPSSSKKKSRTETPPEINDEEFARLQDKLFGDKAEKSDGKEPKAKKDRSKRT